jgi:hypothetical protein
VLRLALRPAEHQATLARPGERARTARQRRRQLGRRSRATNNARRPWIPRHVRFGADPGEPLEPVELEIQLVLGEGPLQSDPRLRLVEDPLGLFHAPVHECDRRRRERIETDAAPAAAE